VYAALLTYPAACVDPLGLSIEERHGNEVGAVEIRHEGDLWNSHRKH